MLYILLALAAFIALLVIRGLMFKPLPEASNQAQPETFDEAKAVSHLQALIRCKTVSYRDKTLEDNAEFDKLEKLLPELFPHVNKVCAFHKLSDRSLLFHWQGKAHDKPGVLMAHYDVVPVNEENWEKPPFAAILEDGVSIVVFRQLEITDLK